MKDTYQTIQSPCEGEFKDRGSRFLAYAYPVNTLDAIKARLEVLKADHPKARHHCFAYRLGNDKLQFRANDDGEPSGTAGKPILGQIDSHQVTNVVVFVVRYFGGTKLGVPGLINAYRSAAIAALGKARIIEKVLLEYHRLHFDYAIMNPLFSYLKRLHIDIHEKHFDEQPSVIITLRKQDEEKITQLIDNFSNLEIEHLYTA